MDRHTRHANVTLTDCAALLEARRRQLSAQLKEFATPIAACDVDFNAMLAERAAINSALSYLEPFIRGNAHIVHPRDDSESLLH